VRAADAPGAVLRAVRGGLTRRRLQTGIVGLVVLISTAAATLALGLAVDARAPFDHAFAAQHGADAALAVNLGRVTPAQLAATRRLPRVTAAAGPFRGVVVTPEIKVPGVRGLITLAPATLVGRASPGGPLDDITLDAGRWATRPDEVVVSRDLSGPALSLGQRITIAGVRGTPQLTVVGIGKSATDTASGWVTPATAAALRAPGAPQAGQMLYRFRAAATIDQVSADVAAVRAALPAGAFIGSQSYLTARLQATSASAAIVPFLVTFAIIGLVLSVLIVANVVSGAVVAESRRIGILKSIGFTPGQVIAVYVTGAGLPALAGCLLGLVLGNVLAIPVLGHAAHVFGVGSLHIPAWVDAAALVGMLLLVAIAALLPALRAGRLSTVEAIASGRSPRPGGGYAAHRLLGRLALPRPLTIGLTAPFTRPARTAVTLAAVLFGATAVVFAVGLDSSVNRVANAQSLASTEPVQVGFVSADGGAGTGSASAQHTLAAALRASPGTRHQVAEAVTQISVSGQSQPVTVHAYRGDSGWLGYDMIQGRWLRHAGEAVAAANLLTVTGTRVGGMLTVTDNGRQFPLRIVGETFDTRQNGLDLFTGWSTMAMVTPGLAPQQYDVGLRPGTTPQAYAGELSRTLGRSYYVILNANRPFFATLSVLIGTLTVLLAVVAGLGVLNTVILTTRERARDLGIFKALGMTPRQTIAMVVCWVAGIGLVGGVVAVVAGIALHRYLVPVMASAAGTGLPADFLHVFQAWEVVLLAFSGLVIAICGALLPAARAARSAPASVLRAE